MDEASGRRFWDASDGIGRAVALLLLAMSVSALGADPVEGLGAAARSGATSRARCRRSGPPPTLDGGRARLRALDREQRAGAAARRRHRDGRPAARSRPAAHLDVAAHAAPARRAAPRPGAPAVRPGAAGLDRQHGAVRRPVRHRLGHLPRAGRHRRGWLDHDREGGRPGGRGADHDRRRPRGGDPRGAGLQHVRQVGRRLRGRARRLRARPARDGARRRPSAGAACMAFGRLERTHRPDADERHQHDAADRRDAGAAGDLHDHRAADDLEPEARPAEGRRRHAAADAPQFVTLAIDAAGPLLLSATSRSTREHARAARARGRASATRHRGAAARRPDACPTAASPS